MAGLLCYRPGLPARLCYRLRRHTGRKGERRSLSERDYIHLLDGAHRLLKAPLIVVWDRLNTHTSKTMKTLVAGRDWLTVVLLPGYAPDLNPVEGLWAHIKRSLANLAARARQGIMLIGQSEAVERAVANNHTQRRNTTLTHRITDATPAVPTPRGHTPTGQLSWG